MSSPTWPRSGDAVGADRLQFDPFLVRGMGYYTGPIFELAHPSVDYSLGGGGRYDGMIGRFLGTEVPATGFSLGFERLVDLVELDHGRMPPTPSPCSTTPTCRWPTLLTLKTELIAQGARVRLVARPKNVKPTARRARGRGIHALRLRRRRATRRRSRCSSLRSSWARASAARSPQLPR